MIRRPPKRGRFFLDSDESGIRVRIRGRTHDNPARNCQNFIVSFASAIPDRSILRRLLEGAFNQGELAVVDELMPPGAISHHPGWGVPANRTGLKQLAASLRTAFPDLHCTIEDEIIHGGKVAAHFAMRGTHEGSFLGHPSTGKPIVVQGLIYARIENGQVVENWAMIDQMGALQQLGLVPPPR
jgi:steroid delta-isomerase-like uncharacterized protein